MWPATFILVALAAHWATAQSVPVLMNNVYDQGSSRIVSGWESKPGQHAHQVSLRMVRRDGAVSGCGGNVVHREWLLTAAHCTATQVTIVVRAGVTHMTRPEMMLETTEYYTYPTYDTSKITEIQHDDIALVKLQRPLMYSKNLRPIRVQPSSDAFRNYDGELFYASGFGRTWTNAPHSQHLMWVYLRAISNEDCVSVFTTKFVANTTICAKFFNVTSQSTCFGDDGGPLVHVSPEGVPTLVGISSFVMSLPDGCHSGRPAGFIRPGPFHAWFTEISGIDFNNLDEKEEVTTVAPTTTSLPASTVSSTQSTIVPSTDSTTIPSPTPTTIVSTQSTVVPSTDTTIVPSTDTTIVPSTDTTTTPSPSPPTSSTTTTTVAPPTTTTEEPDPDEDDSENDDSEISDLLKRLEVRVDVRVKLHKYLKKRKEQ